MTTVAMTTVGFSSVKLVYQAKGCGSPAQWSIDELTSFPSRFEILTFCALRQNIASCSYVETQDTLFSLWKKHPRYQFETSPPSFSHTMNTLNFLHLLILKSLTPKSKTKKSCFVVVVLLLCRVFSVPGPLISCICQKVYYSFWIRRKSNWAP